jgi:rhodanese-related sulfurtransferase
MNQPVAVPEVLSTDLPVGAFLLDVREDDEWAAGHAPDAVHVRLGELGAINVADGMTGWAVAGRPMISEDGGEPYVA